MLAALLILALAPQQQLDLAKVRWQKLHSRSYSYVLTPTCGRCMADPVTIRVRDGKPVGTPKAYTDRDTVPELFAYIQKAIRSKPYRIEVHYGPRSGVPTLVSVDPDKLTVDDVTGFVVQRFRRT